MNFIDKTCLPLASSCNDDEQTYAIISSPSFDASTLSIISGFVVSEGAGVHRVQWTLSSDPLRSSMMSGAFLPHCGLPLD